MKSNIKYILFYLSFHVSFFVCAQTEMPQLGKIAFPTIIDSFPLNIVQNTPCEKGYEAFNNGQFEKAIKFYNSFLVLNPNDPIAIYNRGLCYYKIQDRIRSCNDFKFAAYLGFQNALNNYKSFCDSNSYAFSFLDSGFVYSNSPKTPLSNNENPDSPPEYPGGIDSLYAFIINKLRAGSFKNYNFDKNKRTLIKFTIYEDGSPSNPLFLKPDTLFEKEIISIFSALKEWKPAFKNGSTVICDYLFPVINGVAFIKEGNKFYNKGVDLFRNKKFKESISCFNTAILYNLIDIDAYYNLGICFNKINDIPNACLNWGNAFLINADKKSGDLINMYCDSTIQFKGEKTKLSSLDYFSNEKLFTVIEEMPQFPGGEEKLFEYMSRNIRYPIKARETGITGRVYITFVIDRNGNVKDPKILRGIGGGCDEEALRVIRLMPPWIPGKQDGKNVSVQYNIPINFNMR